MAISAPTIINSNEQATNNAPSNATVMRNSNGQATGFSDGVQIPTSAPSTSQPPNQTQAPAVFSAQPAINKVNNVIAPAITAGNAGIAAQNQKNLVDPSLQMTPAELANPALYTARIAALNASKTNTPATTTQPTAADQAMKDAANTPDPGYQFAYDANGNKQQVPQGQALPAGTTSTPPADPTKNGHTVVQSTTTADGTTYQQYSDGTYGIADQNGQFAGTATAQEYQNAYNNSPETVIQHIQSSLASLSAGAVPLSEPQQAQINALQSQLAQNITTQTQANTNFTGATSVAENLYGMGNSLSGIGAIKATIDSGVAAIQKLQSDAAGAIAKMTDDFQQENYKDMLDGYNAQLAATTAIQTHIENMQKFVETQKVDAQNEAHQNFQDMMTSQNFSLTQKQDTFDNYIRQSQLTEQQKVDATDAWYKQQDMELRQQAQQASAGGVIGGLPTVNTAPGGGGNPVDQTRFLSALPGGATGQVATIVKKLASYQMNPADFTTSNRAAMGGLTKETAVALAEQYNPAYNDANYPAAAKYLASLQSTTGNSTGANIAAVNTAINHFSDFVNNVSSLNNGAIDTVNYVGNSVYNNLPFNTKFQSSLKGAQNDQTALAEQLAKFYKGSGSADVASIDAFNKQLSPNQSPGELQGNVKSTVSLLTGQLDTAYSDYENAMGHAPPAPGQPGSLITATALANLKKLGADTSAYEGQAPYAGTSDSDLINSAPGNGAADSSDPSTFFNNL